MGETINTWVETVFYLVGILAAVLSLYTYRRNSARERTRWLFELYQHFYERPELQKTWRRLDEKGAPALAKGKDDPDLDELLNFFEFIGVLRKRKELRSDEILDMFDYPLKTIGRHAHIREYLARQSYELLGKLLLELGYTRPSGPSG